MQHYFSNGAWRPDSQVDGFFPLNKAKASFSINVNLCVPCAGLGACLAASSSASSALVFSFGVRGGLSAALDAVSMLMAGGRGLMSGGLTVGWVEAGGEALMVMVEVVSSGGAAARRALSLGTAGALREEG